MHCGQTCHLDVGFALTAAGELDNYHKYLLQAAATAADLRDHPGQHNEGLIFTTHPYIVSLLLHCPPGMGFTCPTAAEQAVIRAALTRGDIVMQAFPHNSETATFSPSLFDAALQVSGFASHRPAARAPLPSGPQWKTISAKAQSAREDHRRGKKEGKEQENIVRREGSPGVSLGRRIQAASPT